MLGPNWGEPAGGGTPALPDGDGAAAYLSGGVACNIGGAPATTWPVDSNREVTGKT